jgi:Flp pilus assembly pilin Flp
MIARELALPFRYIPGRNIETNMLKRLIIEDNGQDLVEYGLLAAAVVVGLGVALLSFQNAIASVWTTISNNLAGGS